MSQKINFRYFALSVKTLLIIAILLGAFLRLINITDNPKALYGDELTLVYDTYSILKTGHDSLGVAHPLTFAMGAGRPGGYIYFSLPLVALFGPTALGVRSLSVISGILLIYLMFLLGEELFSIETGLVAAFFMAVSPWDISLSRGGFEAHFALMLAVLGVLSFLWARKKPFLYLLTTVCFLVTINTYPTFKLTLPLLTLVLIWFTGGFKRLFNKQSRNFVILAILILTLGGLVTVYQTFSAGSESRFSNLNLLGQQNLQALITQDTNLNRALENDSVLALPFHNKIEENLFILGDSYLKNLSLNFLFLHGDGDPRHNPGTMGELYLFQLPLIALGLWFLFKENRYRRIFYLLTLWILITPLATAFLLDPHALRNDFMLPPLSVVASVGMIFLLSKLKQMNFKIALSILMILFVIQFAFLIERVYFLAPERFSNFWSYPAKQVSELVYTQKNSFDYVILSSRIDNIEFAYQVYGKINPNLVISQNERPARINDITFKKYDNVYIGAMADTQIMNFIKRLHGSVLYIGSPFEAKSLSGFYRSVYEKDNTVGYIMLEK